jgi:hypothetical protein
MDETIWRVIFAARRRSVRIDYPRSQHRSYHHASERMDLGEKPGQIRKKRTHPLPKSASSSFLPMQEPVTLLRLIRQKQWLSQARPHLQPQPCLRTPCLEGQWR